MLCGGQRHGDKGYFIQPTIFTDVQVINHPTLYNEEKICRYLVSFVLIMCVCMFLGQYDHSQGGNIWASYVIDEIQVSVLNNGALCK